ncbi:protein 60A [Phlebotomus papatasi]|uniref:protein 60A n=1 Tax=Phlebotomus papatasi TaxID=29031 RepID=UPI0024837806|nr:protein 60A [Phlebotomus papatasi]
MSLGLKMNSVLISLVILLIIRLTLASLSGIYVDNGVDQTVLHRTLTQDDQQEVEHEILELLGLPDRPRRRHIHPSLRKSAPQFLMDVYRRLSEEGERGNSRTARSTDEFDNLITDQDQMAIDQSDIIMTFLNKNHHVSEVRHERGRRLWFDVSEVARDSTLMMAELRIYQKPGKWKGTSKTFTITVHTIIRLNGQKELQVLSSVNTTADYFGWLEMNVTDGLAMWTADPAQNKGLYISAHSTDRPDHEVKLEDIGLVNTKGDDEYQPFMVGFFKGQEIIQPTRHTRRIKRSPSKRSHRRKSENRHPLIDTRPNYDHKSCQIQTLYVSFKDLQWQDWIIAPEGYGAFYCSGECNFPLNAHMNATNHAIVQTLVHLMYPSKVPKPCCAPTKLSPISVLYFLDESNVNLKKYKNMVVKSCGCH